MKHQETPSGTAAPCPNVNDVVELDTTLKELLEPTSYELVAGDVRALIGYAERWAESYQRGLTGCEISENELEMLKKTREQLALILSERLTLEDEGGQPANKEQAARMERVASAICHIDQILPKQEPVPSPEPMRKRA